MRRDFIPASTDLLCEKCGYLLNGLPDDGVCPECGTPVAASTVASPRHPPAWEAGTDRPVGRFQFTAFSVLTHPKRFFRTMTAHGDAGRSIKFGRLALLPALLLNSKTIIMHFSIIRIAWPSMLPVGVLLPIFIVTPILVTLSWLGLYAAVIRLTTLESKYWGMRLPADVVRRALHYLAVQVSFASLLPWAVSLVYLCAVIGHDDSARFMTAYLYTLSGAVVITAVYLFFVYATAMRVLMNANR